MKHKAQVVESIDVAVVWSSDCAGVIRDRKCEMCYQWECDHS